MTADECESVCSTSCSVTTAWSAASRASVATTCASDGMQVDWLAAQIDECLAAIDGEQRRSLKPARVAPPALDLSAARLGECIERPLPSSPDLLGIGTPLGDHAVASGSSTRLTFEHPAAAPPSPPWAETDYISPLVFCPRPVNAPCDAAPFPYSPCRESIHMLVADVRHDAHLAPDAVISFTLERPEKPSLTSPAPKERAKDTTALAKVRRERAKREPRVFSASELTPSSTPPSFLSCSSDGKSTDSGDTWSRVLPIETRVVRASDDCLVRPGEPLLGSTRARKASAVSVPRRHASLARSQVSPTSTQIVEEARTLNKLRKLLGEEVVLDGSPSRASSTRRYGSVSAEMRLQKPLPKVPSIPRSQTTDGLDASLLNYLSLSPAKGALKPFFASPKAKCKTPSLASADSSERPRPTLQSQFSSSTDSLRQLASSFPRRRGGVSL